MMMIANLRYRWTLFVLPIDAKDHRDRAAIQLAFSSEATPWATAKTGRRR